MRKVILLMCLSVDRGSIHIVELSGRRILHCEVRGGVEIGPFSEGNVGPYTEGVGPCTVTLSFLTVRLKDCNTMVSTSCSHAGGLSCFCVVSLRTKIQFPFSLMVPKFTSLSPVNVCFV